MNRREMIGKSILGTLTFGLLGSKPSQASYPAVPGGSLGARAKHYELMARYGVMTPHEVRDAVRADAGLPAPLMSSEEDAEFRKVWEQLTDGYCLMLPKGMTVRPVDSKGEAT